MVTRAGSRVVLLWPGKERPPPEPSARRFCASERYGPPSPPAGSLWAGDNLDVLDALARDGAAPIDLVYIDPPFCTGNRFLVKSMVENTASHQDVHHAAAFADCWEGGVAGYLEWLYPRLVRMHALLAPGGSLVVHTDWRVASHVRLVLDEIFGPERLVNELVWYKGFRGTRVRSMFQRAHDILWWYAKSDGYFWSQGYEPYRDAGMKRYNRVDAQGRRYARIKRRRTDGTIYYGHTYPGGEGKWRNDVIADIPTMAATSPERTGYATQKPLKLLTTLIESLCPPGGLVADFFCGTGTTLVAAASLGRRFLGADASPAALHFSRRRLLDEVPAASFTVLRPADALPVPGDADGLARQADGSLRLDAAAPENRLVDLWAAGPRTPGAVFAPAWVGVGTRGAPPPATTPPLGAGPLTVLLSARDGTERWLAR